MDDGNRALLIFFRFVIFIFFLVFPHHASSAAPIQDKLVIAFGSEPKSFNEIVAQETSTTDVTGLMFEGLTRFNPATGEVEPRLAESWEVSPDGLNWVFHLRRGVEWFDGAPFTSRDVVFTFKDLIYNPSIVSAARDVFMLNGNPIDVEPVDSHTVRFHLPQAFAPFLLALNQSIYPEHSLKNAVSGGNFQSVWGVDTPPGEIIGTGPFKLKRYLPGERIELIRNERYWKKGSKGEPLPYIEGIVGLIIPSADGRLLKFLEGETDLYQLAGVDYGLLKPKTAAGRFSLKEPGPAAGSYFLVFNQNAPDPIRRRWFRSRAFRQAAAHALDRQSMIDIVFNRQGAPQCSPLSPSVPFFYNPGVPCYEYDPAKSRDLLAAEGFLDRDGNGFWEDKDGKGVEFVLLTNAENPERLQMAGMVRQDLSRIGFKVHFLAVEFNSLVTKLVATHEWDAVLLGLTGETDPHFGSNVWLSDGTLHFWNAGTQDERPEWEARVDQIFRQAVSVMDRGARKTLYDEWQEIAARELPMIYTVLPRAVYAVRDRVENVSPTALGGALYNIEEIRLRK